MNDERPIEKLLRRYAQKRRAEAGAPSPLHPATRRMLQGEVARQFPKPTTETRATPVDLVTLWVRRWFYAAGLCVVLGLAATILFPNLWKSKSTPELALVSPAEPAPESVVVVPPAPTDSAPAVATLSPAVETDAPNAAPTVPSGGGNFALQEDRAFAGRRPESSVATNFARVTAAEAKKELSAARKPSENQVAVRSVPTTPQPGPTLAPTSRIANEPAKASAPKLTGTSRATRGSLTDTESVAGVRAQPAPVSPASAAAPAGSAFRAMTDKTWVARGGGGEKDAAPIYSQAFANIATDGLQTKGAQEKSKSVKAAMPVLANFQVQQAGNQLRVIDQDGSTYIGEVPQLANQYEANPKRATDPPKLATDLKKQAVLQQQKAEDFPYRVAGTNRTLRQQVVFTWNYVDLTNLVANSGLMNSSAALNFDYSKMPSQLPAVQNSLQNSFQNSFINGRAQLGKDKLIEINAVPVTP